MLAAVFGVWAYTTFEATFIRVGRAQTHWVLLAVMLLGLFMNAAISHAFATRSWAFVAPFLVIQIGRPLCAIVTARKVLREHYIVMLGWIAASAPRRVLRSEHIEFDAAHLLERCRLFLIIALGEAVLTTGTALAPRRPRR